MMHLFKIWLEKITNTYNRWAGYALRNTHHHYFCELPAQISWPAHLLLKLFYRGLTVNTEQTAAIQKIEPNAIIIYANKFQSKFEYLFYYTRYKEHKLPIPEIGLGYKTRLWQPPTRVFRIFFSYFDYFLRHRRLQDPYETGYIQEALISGKSAFLTLIEEKGFYRRFVKAETDPVQYLIDVQQQIERPIYIVPHLMFFDRKPPRQTTGIVDIFFGTEAKPGKLRRFFTLFKNPEKIFFEISTPLNLKEFINEPGNRSLSSYHLAIHLRRKLIVQFNRHRQSITGPVLKSREELKENILTNERLRSIMVQHAEKREVSIHEVYKEASDYIDEIAARYNNSVLAVGAFVVRQIIRIMFDGISVNSDMLKQIKSAARQGPLILVPCHKSHIDYLILSYLFYMNNMPAPHVVAGKNLFFWPLGPFFRAAGAFSIRRSFKGAVFYSKVFAEYIHKLLEEGFNIELFIEGGRSRTGKLIMPQLGFLSILLNAYKNNACEDMNFVPIFVGYDRVPEEKSYLYEIEGGKKKPENLRQVLRARKALKKKYGRIYVRIAEPIPLKSLLEQKQIDLQDASQKTFNHLCRYIGQRLIHAIDRASVVTPHALVAGAVLHFTENGFTKAQMLGHIETFMTYILSQHVAIADTLLLNHTQAAKHVFNLYRNRRFIEQVTPEKDTAETAPLFTVNVAKRHNLEYYKNNSISFFIPAAFTALIILEKDAFQFSAADLRENYVFLQTLFKNEFNFDPDQSPERFVRKTLKAFIDDAILMPHPMLPDTYNLTSVGYRKLGLFARLIKPYLEAYWVVLSFLKANSKNAMKPKDRLKKIQTLGQRMYKGKEIERREALSRIYYENALDAYNAEGIKGGENTEEISTFAEKIRRYLDVTAS
ncbi:MAG: 1-acyl-sn-glycerol-3-phosphate acyltransferase [Desulfobacterales bacterium]|nr:1-acyl-sn-glycerol-3-phosphate acyltransferase [Desulfobacterales bacterium]